MLIQCFCGYFHPNLELPPSPWELDGYTINDYFSHASNRDIELIVDDKSRVNRNLVRNNPKLPATSYNLNQALNILIGNGDDVFPLLEPDTIGLLFASRYDDGSGDDSGLFGIMFNGMFSGNSTYKNFRRQGAAVFVETIRAARSTDQFSNQVIIDSIHEIGHIFNLWHNGPPATLMTRSDPANIFPPPYKFSEDQDKFLTQCSTSDYVRPGRSQFGERGGIIVPPQDGSDGDLPYDDIKDLHFRIEMMQPEFWYFEPVELDITIELAPDSSKKEITIPNEIDPGYERFDILITNPLGKTIHYQPPDIFCRNGRQISITGKNAFHRDISIFGQSGGYTFSIPGIYQLTAELQLGDNKLRSNVIEVNVMKPIQRDKFYRDLEQSFTTHIVSRLLFYRQGVLVLAPFRQVLAIAKRNSKHPSSANLLYALGRNFLHHARHSSTYKRAERNHRRGLEYVDQALNTGVLTGNKARIAERLYRKETQSH